MSKLPDAWDDEWINTADKQDTPASSAPQPVSRSQRKAEHAEANKRLWDAAEQPERFHYLEAKSNPVVKDEFKPAFKVLSRKPTANATNGVAGLSLQDDDSEEEERKRAVATLADRQKRAAIEREEKQRKYAEARERIMGTPATESASNAGNGSRQVPRRGRGNGGRGSHTASSAEQSPARSSQSQPQSKLLFDPGYTSRPHINTARASAPTGEQPIRMPRGPDASGRGGFAARGRGT